MPLTRHTLTDADKVKLTVRNVQKSFRIRGRRPSDDRLLHVLGDVSFDVRQGEVVSLIGESGCGKTTLLKIVQGLIRPDAGTILVDGRPVSSPGRDRGFVFHQQHARHGCQPSGKPPQLQGRSFCRGPECYHSPGTNWFT